MTPPNNQSQEVLREFTGYELYTKWCGRSYQWESLLDIERIRWNNLATQLNSHTTPKEPLKHCSTCKHFKRIYPENHQIGVCEYLEVTNLQPCGHMIDRPLIASDKFVAARGHNICVNRMMDSFGCVHHCPKEKGGDVQMTGAIQEPLPEDLQKAIEPIEPLPLKHGLWHSPFEQGFNEALSERCSKNANGWSKYENPIGGMNVNHDYWNLGFDTAIRLKTLIEQVASLQKQLEEAKERSLKWAGAAGSSAGDADNLRQENAKLETRLKEVEGALQQVAEQWQSCSDKLLSLAKSAGIGGGK